MLWQTGEILKAQSSPFRFLTVWDWSVQFDLKAQAFLNNPLYAEKPKPEKSQRKTARFKVRFSFFFCLTCSFYHLRIRKEVQLSHTSNMLTLVSTFN